MIFLRVPRPALRSKVDGHEIFDCDRDHPDRLFGLFAGPARLRGHRPNRGGNPAVVEETQQLMKEAIEFHLEGLREEGLPMPTPKSLSALVEVSAVYFQIK